jgi:cardiolipin synthase A/B
MNYPQSIEEQYWRVALAREEAVCGRQLVAGNRVTLLVDGPQTVAAQLAAIANAQHHIHMDNYIIEADAVGGRILAALIERRRAGVEVRLLFDAVGSLPSRRKLLALRRHGIGVHEYHPPTRLRPAHLNQRHHRKFLIVDGRLAITGGINASEAYSVSSFSDHPNKAEKGWRDTSIQVQGPAVAECQRIFLRSWQELEGPLEESAEYFPEVPEQGDEEVRLVETLGRRQPRINFRVYLNAIIHACRRIWLTQAYFAPDGTLLRALELAARRGVDVRVLLPAYTDSKLVDYAAQANYERLLNAGLKLYRRHDALLHAKTAVVDGRWSIVGSSNLDRRSFDYNNEADAVVYGRAFGRRLEELFKRDLTRARPIEAQAWRRRPPYRKALESGASLLARWL